MIWFVSCFQAQSERLIHGWMTVRGVVRLQIFRHEFSAVDHRAIIL
jgi:hypothetical protein